MNPARMRAPAAAGLCLTAAAAVILSTASCSSNTKTSPATETASRVQPPTAAEAAFRDSVDTPPADWKGPKFQLSHNYPAAKPPCGPDQAPWLKRKVNFKDANPKWEDWAGYVQDIVDYVEKGQDPNLPDEIGWRTKIDGEAETRWFHIPWMAFAPHGGREFVHGLTNEVTADIDTISKRTGEKMPTQSNPDEKFETWSVGMYNGCGAWAVGQAFPNNVGEPQLETKNGRTLVKGLPFPEGTVVMKVLNSTADGDHVPFMKGSTTWTANTHVMTKPLLDYDYCKRTPQKVHLIQIDLAVVDERSPSRWVYSTLVYYWDEAKKNGTVFDRLHPLGIQWGSDPGVAPVGPSKKLVQSIQAPLPNRPPSVFEHYGCSGRLAGPVDNQYASCVSCHMGAFTAYPETDKQGATIPAIFVPKNVCEPGTPASKFYFSNYPYPSPYPDPQFKNAIPLDTSLQLAVSFQQYEAFKKSPAQVCKAPAPPPQGK